MSLQILLLEDSPLDAEGIEATLFNGGLDCQLHRVETRSAFVSALDTQHIDLILADYNLPGLAGAEALAIARQHHPDLPFLFISGTLGEELAIEAIKLGATDYVVKQRLERLVPCVQRALQAAQEHRDRQHAEQALRESEAKYRTLFNEMDEGYGIAEIIVNDNGEPVDYRMIEVNPQFERLTGLSSEEALSGKTIREIAPELEEHWYQLYGNVGLTGEPIRFEQCAAAWGRCYEVYAFRIGDPHKRHVAILYNDITERKRQEAKLTFLDALAEKLSRLSAAEDIIQVVGVMLGKYLKVTACNFCEVDEDRDEVIYLGRWTVEDAPPLPDRLCLSNQVSADFYARVRAGETVVSHDTHTNAITNVQANAAIGVRSFITVPFHENGTWKYLFSVHDRIPRSWRDDEITLVQEIANRFFPRLERAHAEAKLSESEAKYRSILTTVDEGLLIAEVLFDEAGETIDYRCLEVNPAFYVQTGLSTDVVGMTMREIAPGKPIPWLPIYGEVVRSQRAVRFEYDITLDELRGYYDIHVLPLGDPAEHRVAVLFKNISDRKKTEQKIQEQAALLDITSDAIMVRDLEHYILYWNQGATRLYGWQATEAIGQNASQLLQENPEQLQAILQTLFTQGEWRGELHKTAKPGNRAIVEARWTLIRDTASQPQYILAVDTDITQKKQLEAQFYRTQRLESLGTLASGIAHDLNNVLTPMMTIAQLLQAIQPNLTDQSRDLLQLITNSARRGSTLIKQLLTFARGTGEEYHHIQAIAAVQDVLNIVQQSFPKTITICHRFPDPCPWFVAANSTYLHQVLMNLCINARDAMPDGGVLTLSIEHCAVDQALAQAHLDAKVGDYVVITVADTGTGIPVDIRDRIFDPFFTTKSPGEGSGLGLATVLGIMKEYGGFLQVISEVNHGTQMKVYLPIIAGALPSSTPPPQSFTGTNEVILVVDDDDAVQRSTQSILETHHYTVLSAQNGIDAIALYTQHQDNIRAVILDITMPTMDGITLIQKLRAINATVKIMAMSGLPMNRDSALNAGANLFLPKPYTIEILLEKLQDLLTKNHF